MSRLMVFAYDGHESAGGMNDLLGIVNSLEEAKALVKEKEHELAFGYAEYAEAWEISDPPILIAEYTYLPHLLTPGWTEAGASPS